MKKELLQFYIICFLLFLNQILVAQSFSSGTLNTRIPNNSELVYFTLNASGLPSTTGKSFGLETVTLNIAHTADFNIDATLVSPNGTHITLTSGNGSYGDNYTNTVFSMKASNSIIKGQPPFTGTFKPTGDYGVVNNGGNPNGSWGLIIKDNTALDLDSGTVISWGISFSTTPYQSSSFSSTLPIMVINTKGQGIPEEPKVIVDMGIIYKGPGQRNALTDAKNHYNGKAAIEMHGSSSNYYSPKKSYAFLTVDNFGKDQDTSLLGLPSEHNWVLHASYFDKTLMRNALSYKIFGEMGHYSPRVRYVELVLDGQYQGIYVLVEKIKRGKTRVKVDKIAKSDFAGDELTGGYIIKIDRLNAVGPTPGWPSKFMSFKDTAVYFQYVYPDPDSLIQVQKTYIKNYIDSFETVLMGPNFKDPINGYRKYVSITSFIDKFILNELSKNVDGYRLSEYIYKDKNSKGGKLKNGPAWDYDIAYGNCNFGEGTNKYWWQYLMPGGQYFDPVWWKRFMEDESFKQDLYCRYTYLRKNALNLTHLNQYIDSVAAGLNEAKDRNFTQWPVLGIYVWPNPSPYPPNYAEEVKALKDWLRDRLDWMDKNIKSDGTTCPIVDVHNMDRPGSSFKAFPNPFKNSLSIYYELPHESSVKLELFNSLGALVCEVTEGQQEAGTYNKELSIEHFPAGVYMLKLIVEDQEFNKKIIKMQ